MFTAKQQGVIYIHRDGIDCVFDGSGVLSFPFQKGVVEDLDIVDKEALLTTFSAFIDANKIVPTSFIMVLGDNVVFEKDIVLSHPQPQQTPSPTESVPVKRQQELLMQNSEILREMDTQIQHFLAVVPLETIIARQYTTPTGGHVVAANREMLDSIRNAFIAKGSMFISVVPRFIFGDSLPLTGSFTREAALMILKKTDIAKQNSMFEEEQQIVRVERNDNSAKEKVKRVIKNKRLYAFIGIFLVLMLVLGFVAYQTNKENETIRIAEEKAALRLTPTVTPLPTVATPAPSETATPSAMLAALKVKISYPSSASVIARSVKAELEKIGLRAIALEVNTSPPGKTIVLFAPGVSEALREQIFQEAEKSLPDIDVQEGVNGTTDVSIFIAAP